MIESPTVPATESSPVRTLVVGSGGLLGGGVLRETVRRGGRVERVSVPWGDASQAAAVLIPALVSLVRAHGPWRLFWCAGTGVVATGEDAFAQERALIDEVLAAVLESADPAGTDPEGAGSSSRDGTVFFASSAGALFAGSSPAPFDESSEVAPLAPYGRSKLALEGAFRDWSAAVGARLLVGRISNLYGPGQNIAKPQGLVSHLIAEHLAGGTSNIYVPRTTVRDYLFITDAARMILDAVEAVETEGRADTLKIFATGAGESIDDVIATIEEVLGERLRIDSGADSSAAYQSLDLRFRSTVLTAIDAVPRIPFVEGVRLTADSLRQARADAR